ncbi:ABC transporter ATP-binding protein [Actinoplanes subtropicus]|uniref:ABC transporter ATP-binding protein n=1 Tax=Actinoplanes subtropicus TaxID=543632 RepID=UPI00068F1792|nr:ABC transporter ATP-binding protein [Actinoplanes subtropicus]
MLLPLDIGRQLLTPEILRRFIDSAVSGRIESTGRLVVVYFALVVAGLGTSVLMANISAKLAWSSTNDLRDQIMAGLLRQNASFFAKASPGELVDRIDNDTARLGSTMSGLLLDLAAQTLLAVGIIAALCRLDWRFGVLFLPFTAAMLVLLRRQAGRALPYIEAQRETEALILGAVDEWTTGAEDLRTAGGVDHVRSSLWELGRREYRTGRLAAATGARWPATVQALSVISTLLALALGVELNRAGTATVGTVFAALSYATLIRFPLTQIASRALEAQTAVVSLRRVRRLLVDRPAEGTARLAPNRSYELVFDRVTFGYDEGPAILRDVSFRLPAGQILGLVGRTGSGKSTIIKLAFRHLVPSAGRIHVGGHDLSLLNRASLRRSVAYIPQGITLFDGTLRDNLTLFATGYDDRALLTALREAGLGALLESLPDGLDTRLDAGWNRLSTGEGQMLNLARAFLTDPAIVLLDEPSSQIDPHAERALREALRRFARGRTAVIVSHRLETLEVADRILVLDDGQVAEYGARAALLADPGSAFARLIAAETAAP